MLAVVVSGAAPAAADGTIFANVYLLNNTNCPLMISQGSSSVSGVWHHAPPFGSPFTDAECTSGAPNVKVLGAHQMMDFGSASNGGLFPSGTGGSLSFPVSGGTASLTWSLPWLTFNGFLDHPTGSATVTAGGFGSPFHFDKNVQGPVTCSGDGGNTCIFEYELESDNDSQCVPTGGVLMPGQCLSEGTSNSLSDGGGLNLVLGAVGSLYVANNGSAVWFGTFLTDANVAIMQNDGNFVVYDPNGVALYASNTWGNPGAYLTVDSHPGLDHGVIVHAPGGAPLAYLWH
jgi:hypothetical protein